MEFAFTMVCTRHRQGEVQNGPCCLAGLCCRSVFGNYIKLAFFHRMFFLGLLFWLCLGALFSDRLSPRLLKTQVQHRRGGG